MLASYMCKEEMVVVPPWLQGRLAQDRQACKHASSNTASPCKINQCAVQGKHEDQHFVAALASKPWPLTAWRAAAQSLESLKLKEIKNGACRRLVGRSCNLRAAAARVCM